jgi:CheY-like chemotaxis protein
MTIRRLFLPALTLISLTACLHHAGAQDLIKGDKKGESKQEATKKIIEKAQEDYRTFFKEPTNTLEYWAALSFEMQVGKFDVAGYHLDKLLKLPEKDRDEALLQIEDAEGMNTFLRLREVKEWSKQPEVNAEYKKNVETLIDTVMAALERKLSDQERIKMFIESLFDRVPEVRGFALQQVKRSKAFASALLAEKLRKALPAEQDKLKSYMLDLDRDILPPMLELLRAVDAKDAADVEFRMNLLWLLKQRLEKRAIPYLWYLSASPQFPEVLRERAKDTLAYLLESDANRLVPAKVALTQLAEKYYQHKVRFPDSREVSDLDNPAKTIVVPAYKIWPLVDRATIAVKPRELRPDEARMEFGMRYAAQALELDKGYQPAQVVYLSFLLEQEFHQKPYDAQLDKLLTQPRPPALQQLLAKIDIDLLNSTLERALTEHNYVVILPLVDALGERGEVRSALATSSGAPGLLVKALYYPDRRVQYAAARAMLRLPSSQAPVASARIVDVLSRFLRTDTTPRVLFVYAKDQRATELRDVAKAAKYDADAVPNVKEALAKLHQKADYDAIILDKGIPDAELPFAVAQLRGDSDAGLLPLLLVATPEKKADLTRTAERTPNTFVLPSAYLLKGEDFKRELEDAIKFAAAPEGVRKAPEDQQQWLKYEVRRDKGQQVSEEERRRFGNEAMDWFALMARGELTGYDLKPAEDAFVQSLNDKDHAAQSLHILARFPGSITQQRLAGVLFDVDRKALHVEAAKELNRHIQKHGLVLSDDEITRLREMERRADIPPEVRTELAILVGTLRATAQQSGDRLLRYERQAAPPSKDEK